MHSFELLPDDDPDFIRTALCKPSTSSEVMVSVVRDEDLVLVQQMLDGVSGLMLALTADLAEALAHELLAAAALRKSMPSAKPDRSADRKEVVA